MSVQLTSAGLRVDRSWTDAETERYRSEVLARGRDPVKGWYHRFAIDDIDGRRLETPGQHPCHTWLEALDSKGFPADCRGKSVLDVGCNAGYYSFIAYLRGAVSVIGIDRDPYFIDQAKLVREILQIPVEFRPLDVYDLEPRLGTFDVVLCSGLLYHLQNPLAALTRIAAVTRDLLFVEAEVLVDPHFSEYARFIENTYAGDPDNWWICGPRCLEGMARAAGFTEAAFQGFFLIPPLPPPGAVTSEGLPRQGRGVFICRK